MSGPQEAISSLEQRKPAAMLPAVLGAAARSSGHYSALPPSTDGGGAGLGWSGAEPGSGHGGRNKSQMCQRDREIHGQAPFQRTFK